MAADVSAQKTQCGGNITVTPSDSISLIRALGDLKCALIDAQVKQAAQFRDEIASVYLSQINHTRFRLTGADAGNTRCT
jgi:hypothetical protein